LHVCFVVVVVGNAHQPPPPPKVESKWEKFAREKGIAPKTKRSRKVWDETAQQWLFRTGYQKANNDKNKEWPIMEVPDGQDPYQDPWQVQREAKRARIDDNVSKRLKNQEQAGVLAKGTANKILKAKNKAREIGKAGDTSMVCLPAGVPVDLGHAKKESKTTASEKLRGKTSTMKALIATQRSTASLGKFDKPREGEPERREPKNSKKKRKLVSPDNNNKVSETERNAKLLASIGDNAVAKEKARKKGKLATGETAYDYEFSDGLGASSFRKKKGRAGAGKMKKMTKKRVK
jgi:regulator of ribosome biosynthesis